jgi:hypothetical protein
MVKKCYTIVPRLTKDKPKKSCHNPSEMNTPCYYLILISKHNESPDHISIQIPINTERIPIENETISTQGIHGYLNYLAKKDNCPDYVKTFANSTFIVKEVFHELISKKNGLETIIQVTAEKI